MASETPGLEDELFELKLNEKNIAFIMDHGERFVDSPKILAMKLSIDANIAEQSLAIIKRYKEIQISNELERFKREVKENPNMKLTDIALLNDFSPYIVEKYLESVETKLTDIEKQSIKGKLNAGYSIPQIADQLRVSQKKIAYYIEKYLLTFTGIEGEKILEIIYKHSERHPIVKLKEMIITKNVSLQEKLCCELPKINKEEFETLQRYFMKFEQSEHFFEIDDTLSIKDKICMRECSLENISEFSLKLNRIGRVISDYLQRYEPDESILNHLSKEQFEKIQKIELDYKLKAQISHTVYRMIISNSFDDLIQDAHDLEEKSPKGIFEKLLPLVFYYIKCSLPLKNVTEIFANITNSTTLTTLDIFHLIFQMSDPVVRGLCIEHYSFSNPVPFYYPILGPYPPEQTSCQFEICKELWYSLQQFSGLVSFGLGWASWNPIGKSHLLDLMFKTDFVKGSPQNSPFHLGSIDIQMTKNILGESDKNTQESTQWAYIDCHGCSDVNVISEMCQNVDIALIHVSYSDYRENLTRLEENLTEITVNTKHVYLLVRDYTGNDVNKKQISLKGKVATVLFIPKLIPGDINIFSSLKKNGYTILHSTNASPRFVESNSLENLIIRFGNWDNQDNKEIINRIKTHICKNFKESSNDEVDYSFLSFYPHYVKYMSCYYETSNQTDQKKIDELNEKCELLAKHLENAEMSAIVWHFNEILAQKNSPLILWKLSQELNMLSKNLNPASSTTSYTLEILWREALLTSKYYATKDKKKSESKYLERFSSNFSNHVERGEPFELIDGDNLRFFNQDINVLLSKFYERQNNGATSSRKRKHPPIVVSIFGPQSSGKSTLLNYCFGCKFLTSAGRCTKGIYASLSKLSQPINNSEHFLILDTEGLDSNEKIKSKNASCLFFDRTMVLFCLAVSQVVIINVKGELGEEMQNILQICAYSLNKLKVSKVATPKIFFVLNQQANLDPNKYVSSINSLLDKLNKESYLMETEGLKISDLIQVSEENLFVLPSAFNSESLNTQMTKLFDSDLCKLSPADIFANKCTKLRNSIIQQLNSDTSDHDNESDKIPYNSMSEWMEMSGVIWDTIVKYQDIVKYRNTEEIRCNNKLSQLLHDLMNEIIYSKREEFQEITDQIIIEMNQISKLSLPEEILEDIKKDLDEVFEKYQKEALNIFVEECQEDPLLKKMDYLCAEARANLRRLIYMEKKIYEDKLKFEIKARLTEMDLTEHMTDFQEAIEQKADKYFDLTIEEQNKQFEDLWMGIFGKNKDNEGESDIIEKFDDLYSVFRMESNTMENRQTIYALFRELNFDMNAIIEKLGTEMLFKFCKETDQYIYPWKENRVPLKEMTPYERDAKYEYLTKNSFYTLDQNKRDAQASKPSLKFRKWVPPECYPLVNYCSGYYNHPDVIWKLEKRKQILKLVSQLKDPNSFERSTWDKLISDIAERVKKFTKKDKSISHSTVKEIVDFLCYICKLVNYEINFIEAKLTNTAERTFSTFAFAFAFKSILKIKLERQEEIQSKEIKRKEDDRRYFLQKVENRKLARGNWKREEMRNGDQTMAKKFAGDFIAAVCRGVSTDCKQNINTRYFNAHRDMLSHKNILLRANEKLKEDFYCENEDNSSFPNEQISEDNFVIQFVCNRNETLKLVFQEEWMKVTDQLYRIIIENMKHGFIKQTATIKVVLTEFLRRLDAMITNQEELQLLDLDADSNFEAVNQTQTEESASITDPKIRVIPFKAMVLFLKMYLDPAISGGNFKRYFCDVFQVDGVKVKKHRETHLLFEKLTNSTQVLDRTIFRKLSDTNMFKGTETIFNIKVYVQEFLRTLNSHEYQVTEADFANILKATKKRFEANVINCPKQCPSCGKFCEREMHPHGGRCRIMTGHQMCSMGGKVWEDDRYSTAVLLMCDDYNDDTLVIIPGQSMRWWKFKEKYGNDWDWSLPTDEEYVALQKEHRYKMKKIWGKYGTEILKYYEKRGTRITYITYDQAEETYKHLFISRYYICFVIDGTDLMGEAIQYIKKWVSDVMKDSQHKGRSQFKLIVYPGDSTCQKDIMKIPYGSGFISDTKEFRKYLETIDTSGFIRNELPMLHGLAIAAKESNWKSGFGVKNLIAHFYVEPTKGHFNIFTAEGKCEQGCNLDWKRDIRDKMKELNIEYQRTGLINYDHPDHVGSKITVINHKTPCDVTLKSGKKSKFKSHIFINHKANS